MTAIRLCLENKDGQTIPTQLQHFMTMLADMQVHLSHHFEKLAEQLSQETTSAHSEESSVESIAKIGNRIESFAGYVKKTQLWQSELKDIVGGIGNDLTVTSEFLREVLPNMASASARGSGPDSSRKDDATIDDVRLSIKRVEHDGQVGFELVGDIDAAMSFNPIINAEEQTFYIDINKLGDLSGEGIGSWLKLIKRLQDKEVVLRNCPAFFIDQANSDPHILGRVKVESFYLPFYCEQCNCEKNVAVTSTKVREAYFVEEIDETFSCSTCGGHVSFFDEIEMYLQFLEQEGAFVEQEFDDSFDDFEDDLSVEKLERAHAFVDEDDDEFGDQEPIGSKPVAELGRDEAVFGADFEDDEEDVDHFLFDEETPDDDKVA